MPAHDTPLIATIAIGFVLAFLFGMIAQRLRTSPLVGYLVAGIVVGPFTPGFVADPALAGELAEIGVILLMFAVGLHFSLKDLMSVRAIALPGAVVQILVATLLGMGLAHWIGWSLGAGLVFGLALSVASTVVLVRALQERRMMDTERGRIAVGWLVVEDLVIILALVLLPTIAPLLTGDARLPLGALALAAGLTLLKVAAFVGIMLVAGRRVIPWILHEAAHTGSRELFRLAVYAIALGIAFGAVKLFDVSFALAAFFAGMVLAESQLSQRATEEALPLRDAFAVLFFVSVGMLFNPEVLLTAPLHVAAAVLIVLFGKSVAAFVIVRAFGHPTGTALTISASLAQIGELSFILVGLGVALGLLPAEGRDLVLAAAILSILVNPLLFAALDRWAPQPPIKVIVWNHPDYGVDVAAALEERFGAHLSITRTHEWLVEATAAGVDKGSGLRKLCDLLDVEIGRVIAVGDSDNDIPMLRAAGLGVAMGNANERVKAVADWIAPSLDEDGVAATIQRWVLEPWERSKVIVQVAPK